jgi:hypothetical protein
MRGKVLHITLIVAVAVTAALVAWLIKDDTPISSPQTTYAQLKVLTGALAAWAKAHAYIVYHLL